MAKKKKNEDGPKPVARGAFQRRFVSKATLAVLLLLAIGAYVAIVTRSSDEPARAIPRAPETATAPVDAGATPSKVGALTDEARRGIQRCVDGATVPIVEEDHLKEPFPDANGVLLAVGRDHFLVTARHVIERFAEAKIGFAIADAKGQMIGVKAGATYKSKGPWASDPVDIAAVKLDEAVAALLTQDTGDGSPHKDFLPITSISVEPERPKDNYLVFGYPPPGATSEFTESNRLAVFTHVVVSWSDEAQYAPAVHLAFAYFSAAQVEAGARPMPSLSGGGAWLIRTTDPSKWSASDIRLVGIQHAGPVGLHARTDDALFATRASYLFAVLGESAAYARVISDAFPSFDWPDAGAPGPAPK